MTSITGWPLRARVFMMGLLILAVLIPSALPALDLTAGALRMELIPSTSSFRIYLRTQAESVGRTSALQSSEVQLALPLLYPDDPTTSYFTLLENGRVYHPAHDSNFRRTLIETETGHPAFVFTSRDLEVRQVFIPTAGRRIAADAFEMRFEIHNSSTRPRTISLRYVLDTHLGEKSGIHGVLELSDGSQQIPSYETSFEPGKYSAVRTTLGSAAPGALGLRIPFISDQPGDTGNTTPQKVVIANWRRIDESGWDYTPVSGRGFSYPPYSRNDSAIVLFYPETTISPGEGQQFAIQLQATPNELSLPRRVEQTRNPVAEQSQSDVVQDLKRRVEEFEAAELSATQRSQRQLALIDEIISEIDRSMSEQGELNESDLQEFEQLLQRLE